MGEGSFILIKHPWSDRQTCFSFSRPYCRKVVSGIEDVQGITGLALTGEGEFFLGNQEFFGAV